jgi:hypothetical protein
MRSLRRSRLRPAPIAVLALAITAIVPSQEAGAHRKPLRPTRGTRQVVQHWTFTGRRSLLDLATGDALKPAAASLPAGSAAPSSGQTMLPGNFRPERRRSEGEHKPEMPGGQPALPSPATATVRSQALGFAGFQGLGTVDDAIANRLVSEPPDQGLCVGAGRMVEAVNLVLTVYGTDGSARQLLPETSSGTSGVAVNEFFGVPPLFADGSPPRFGPDLTDPTCHFDQDVQRFFLTVSGLDTDPLTGDYTGRSKLYLAVTATADPLGEWATFTLDTSRGDRFDHGCPCLDDFPHTGADGTGFYISANRYQLFGLGFVNAKIHATAKRVLAAAAAARRPTGPELVTVTPGPAGGSPAFTLQPAITPPGAPFAPGREYFLSTPFAAGSDHRIVVWALSNTTSLDRSSPKLRLTHRVVETLPYAEPQPTVQRSGPFPLGQFLGEPLSPLDSGLDWISEAPTFADGRLWTAMSTAVAPGPGGTPRTGVLWMIIEPSGPDGEVGGRIDSQGYLAVDRDSLLYPAVGVNPEGRGAMVFSVAGPGRFPSAAFVEMDDDGPVGPVRVVANGVAPEDGHSCYTFGMFDPAPCRWGDYSAARVDEQGNVWMATEYIGPGSRTRLSNWSTFVGRLAVGDS